MKKMKSNSQELVLAVEKFINNLTAQESARPHYKRSIFDCISPTYTDEEDEIYEDYNSDDPSPIDEEPEYDTDEELYLLYRRAVLLQLN